MIRSHTPLTLFGISTFAALVAACGGASTGEVASIESALTEAESELTGAEDSLAAAKETADACFGEYKACETAEGPGHAACRSALEACLPEDAPTPGRCGPHPGRRGDAGALDGTRPPPPPDGEVADGELPPPPPPSGEVEGRGEGGVRPPHAEGERHRRHRCAPPPIPRERLGACRDEAGAAARASDGGEEASGKHARCVDAAFGDRLGALCAKAAELCKDPAAPADICARVTDACASRTTSE